MTVSSEVFVPDAMPASTSAIADGTHVRGARPRPRARESIPATDSDDQPGRLVGRVRHVAEVVWGDLAGSWLLHEAQAPTVAELWRNRIPALDRVPGQSRPLQVGWAVYNHVVLAVFVPVAFGLWLLLHPARLALTLLLAIPILTVVLI